jgi:tetratricopeptide (TPR) repeat protein
MKKYRIVLMLLAAALVAVASVGCSARAKKMYHLERADRLYNAGQYSQAEIEYLNVLRADPQNPDAMGRLGTIYFNEGRFQKAAPYLYKGCQLDTTNLDLHLKLSQIYLAIGMMKEAHSEAGFVLDRNSQDPEAPVYFAQSISTPADATATQNRLTSLAKNNGDNVGLETAQGVLVSQQHDYKTALADFQRALGLNSHFPLTYVALGNTYLQQDESSKAESALKAGADCASPRSPLQMEYGQFEIQSGNFAAAQNFFEGLTTRAPDFIPAWLGLAEVALDQKDFTDCSTALNKALAADADNVDALVLQARLDLANSNIAKGTDELERLVKLYPQAPRIHYQLALAYIVGNQPTKALNQLHEAVSLDINLVQASFLLAQMELQTGDTDSAVDLLKRMVAQRPSLAQAKLLLADAYRTQNNLNGAMEIYAQLQKVFPQNAQIPVLMGVIDAQQQNETAARQEFNRALQMDPNNEDAQEGMAQLDFNDQQYAAAQDRLEKIISRNPQQAMPQMILAKIYMAEGQTNQAEISLLKAAEMPGGSSAYLILAQIYSSANQNKDALDMLKLALGNNPKNVSALMLEGIIQANQKNYQAAADAYEQLLAINPQYSPALNNLAWIYCDNLGDLNKAFELAQRARQLLPNDPSTADTLGWVFFRKGDYTSAVNLFQDSANALSDNPEVQFHLGIAHYMLADETVARDALQSALDLHKDFPERSECQDCLSVLNIDPNTADAAATANLEKRISEQPNDPMAFTRLAAIYQRNNDSSKTIALCEKVLKASPQNFKADILLAQLLASSNPSRAYDLAKAAYQLKPSDTEVCATLGKMASLNGNDPWAYTLLEQASQSQPDNAQVQFDFANAAFCVGKISDAETAMQNALQGTLPAAESAEAQNFTNIVALYQNPDQSAAASPHVDEILSSHPDNAPALFASGIIQTQDGNPIGAERSYEQLLDRHPNCVIAQKELTILYARNLAEPDKAYPVAIKAREAFPDDPQVAKALAVILFQRGDYAGAANLFNSISDSASADAQVFYYLGISEFRLKNFDESKRSLRRAVSLNLSGPQATDARETLAELNN